MALLEDITTHSHKSPRDSCPISPSIYRKPCERKSSLSCGQQLESQASTSQQCPRDSNSKSVSSQLKAPIEDKRGVPQTCFKVSKIEAPKCRRLVECAPCEGSCAIQSAWKIHKNTKQQQTVCCEHTLTYIHQHCSVHPPPLL